MKYCVICVVLVVPNFDIFSSYYKTNNLNTTTIIFLYVPAVDRGLQGLTPISIPDKMPYSSSDRIHYIIVILKRL